MPVEFYCQQCEAYLRAPDSRAGLATNCPHCRQRIWIPYESVPADLPEDSEAWDEGDTPVAAAPRGQPVKPIRSRRRTTGGRCGNCAAPTRRDQDFCRQCGHRIGVAQPANPAEIDLGLILSETWHHLTSRLLHVVSVTILDLIITIVMTVVVVFVGALAANMGANLPGNMVLMFLAVTALGWCVAMSTFATGHMRFYLDLCRTQRADLQKAVYFDGPVLATLLGGVLYWVTFPLILPAIFLWPIGRIVVDQNVSAGRAAWIAAKLTSRHPGICFSLFAIKVAAFFISGLVPVLGLILVTPYLAILNTVAYLHLIGERE